MSKRAAVLGALGQLGVELVRELKARGYEVASSDRDEVDITDPAAVESALASFDAQVVFNAAAYNQVDVAEKEPQAAFVVNALAVRNLALACPSCNLQKADRIMAIDPETGTSVSLFHPVRQAWSDHFRFSGLRIEGSTPTGRATVAVLDLNHLRRQRIRAVEQRFGPYPPIR